MNKVNIFIVVRDHVATLYDDTTDKFSVGDLAFFYLLPLALGIIYFMFPFDLPPEVNGALIAVFSVFAALLFSAQMALYGLSPREPSVPHLTQDSHLRSDVPMSGHETHRHLPVSEPR